MNQRRKRQRVKAIIAAKARARASVRDESIDARVNSEPPSIEWDVLPANLTRAPRQSVLRDPYIYLILILPILVLARNTSYIYTAAGSIDPWVYYGYMKHLVAFKGSLFPQTYYGSRLSWLLPGALIHATLPPVPATYVLHLAVFFTSVFSLYWLLKEALDRRVAILSAISMALYPYFWAAIGWDYVDGVGIAYYLLTMALVFAAARPATHNRWLLICGGMAWAGMVYSNLAWLIFSPVFLTLYLWFSPALTIRALIGRTVRFLMWFGLGWLIVTVVLGTANRYLEGTFWFYAPSVFYALSTVGKKNPWRAANYGWIKTGYWLILPCLACLGSLFICATTSWRTNWRNMRTFLALNLLCSAALLVYMEAAGQLVLQLSYYASYLIPSSILAFGAALFEGAAALRASRFRLIVAGALFGLLCIWTFIAIPVVLTIVETYATSLLFAGIGITAVGILLRGRAAGAILGLAGLTVFSVSLRAVSWSPGNGADVFRRISSGMELVENARGDQPVRFWFDQNDPYSAEFHSLNSCYLWGYTAINFHFPLLDKVAVGNGAFVVVPSSKSDVSHEAAGAFAALGSNARFLGKERTESGGHGYWVNFFRIEPDRDHMAPLQVSFDPAGVGHLETLQDTEDAPTLPADHWKISPAGGHASMQTTPEGVVVEAPESLSGANTSYAEIVVGQKAIYRFVLKYHLLRGDVGFTAVSGDSGGRVDQDPRFYGVGRDTIREFTAALDPNQPIRLLTSSKHIGSRYVIEELRAYRMEDSAPR